MSDIARLNRRNRRLPVVVGLSVDTGTLTIDWEGTMADELINGNCARSADLSSVFDGGGELGRDSIGGSLRDSPVQ